MKSRTLLIFAAYLCALTLPVGAADWPQWRGPNRDGVSKETGLLKSWPENGPPLVWTCEDAGVGYSGPAVVGDRLFTLGGNGETETVYALDVQAGKPKKVWSTEVAPLFEQDRGDGPRGNPTVDGDRLYALGGQGELICVETATGKRRWNCNLRRDLGGQ